MGHVPIRTFPVLTFHGGGHFPTFLLSDIIVCRIKNTVSLPVKNNATQTCGEIFWENFTGSTYEGAMSGSSWHFSGNIRQHLYSALLLLT